MEVTVGTQQHGEITLPEVQIDIRNLKDTPRY